MSEKEMITDIEMPMTLSYNAIMTAVDCWEVCIAMNKYHKSLCFDVRCI